MCQFYIRTQSVSALKHSPPRLYKTSLLMLCKAKAAVCYVIRAKHINAMWDPCGIYECSTRSPFVTLLSRLAQSGRWSSHREAGLVHRMTFSFSDFLFYLCFIYSWYKTMEGYIQLNNSIISRKLTQSLLCTPSYTTLVRDWLPYWTASFR